MLLLFLPTKIALPLCTQSLIGQCLGQKYKENMEYENKNNAFRNC